MKTIAHQFNKPNRLSDLHRLLKSAFWITLLSASVMLLLVGCSNHSQEDANHTGPGKAYEEAQNRVKQRDYKGAIVAYEAELRDKPDNAEAHLEVAILHQKRTYDFAAAIFHYQKFLDLRPDSDSRISVEKSIEVCKRAIASTVELEPNSFALQKHVTELTKTNEKRTREIQLLEQKNADLTGDISKLTAELAKLAAEIQRIKQQGAMEYAKSLREGGAATAGVSQEFIDSIVEKYTLRYTIQPGDSFWKIANDHNIDVALLQSANPDLSAKSIRPGDVMNIPKKPE